MNDKKAPKNKRIRLFTNTQIIIAATAVFAVLFIFLDNSSLQDKRELDRKLEQAIRQRDSLAAQIASDSTIIRRIETDDNYLERYAREHFFMKRPLEDVFIMESSSDSLR